MKSEKGDKKLAVILRSGIRRWFRYLGLLGIGAAIVLFWGPDRGGNTASPSLRVVSEKRFRNVALLPPEDRTDADEWSRLTREQMKEDYLKCDYDTKKKRRVHDADTWMGMREAYISVVGKTEATVELDDSRTYETAFRLPFEVRYSGDMGRGIFAMKDVKKGEVLYDFSVSAQFRKASEFAEFLRIIQPDLACDVLMWSYVQYFGEGYLTYQEAQNADLRIITDLDPGSFCNDGDSSGGNMAWLDADGSVWIKKADKRKKPAGINPAKITRKNGSVRQDAVKSAPLVAVRDIQKGEELLCIYSQFSEGLSLMIT